MVWLVEPTTMWAAQWGSLSVLFIPIALLISILRFNLFDIDRLISGTAAYTLVGIVLLAGLLLALPPAAGVL